MVAEECQRFLTVFCPFKGILEHSDVVRMVPLHRQHTRTSTGCASLILFLSPLYTMAIVTTAASLWLAVVVALAAAGGTAIVAETSEPGDVLYPVKTSVNERILGSLALSSAAEARWESSLALRRAQEAAELAAEGRLSADVSAQLQEEFEAHSETALAHAQDAAAEGSAAAAADAAATFATELSAQGQTRRGMTAI